MKKIYFLLLLAAVSVNAQIVNIPNANFKAKLLAANETNNIASTATNSTIPNTFNKIDVNNDGEIQVSEAANVTLLNVSSSGISNLTGIEAFPNLRVLKCSNNQIANLDVSIFPNMVILECYNNDLSQLDVSGLTYLQTLFCYDNQLTTLGLNNLPSLSNLYCQDNQLTTLDLSTTPILFFLGCQNNQLTALDASNKANLQSIICYNNELETLNVTNAVNLIELSCGYNLFTTLNLNTNVQLKSLSLYGCQNLQSLFMHNGSDESANIDEGSWWENWIALTSLQYICADENEIAPLMEVLDAVRTFNTNLPPILVNTYCSFTPGGSYNTIAGKQLFDADNNGCDVADFAQSYIKVNINDGTTTGSAFTNATGNYKFYTQAGNFTLTPQLHNPTYFDVNPVSSVINFPTVNNSVATQDYCITANGIHQDLEIVIAPIVPARPGFEAVYKIVYKNNGNTVMSQDYGVSFFYNHNMMNFVSADIEPSTNGPGALSWTYNNLMPFESRAIIVTMQINPPTDPVNPVNINDVLVFNSNISPVGPDENQIDNYGVFNQTVVGSFDPNDIQCIEGDVVSPSEIGNYLHYLIRFENTGTAAAENIVVKTEINPEDFDMQTLQLMNASHTVDARINGNRVEFIFKNIMLDSGGHGNILLKIKSNNNLQIGDVVNKMAGIYFDYNFPVLTNEAATAFQTLSAEEIEKDFAVKVYPNPTQDNLNISGKAIRSIQLFDIHGRILMTKIVNAVDSQISMSHYARGTYFVKVTTEKGSFTQKIIKK